MHDRVAILIVPVSLLVLFVSATVTFGEDQYDGLMRLPCDVPFPEGSSPCNGGDVVDDGSPDSYLGHSSTGSRQTLVQLFSPPVYPSVYYEVCLAWSRNGADSNLDYEIVFYDDDGPAGKPGTLLEAVPASASGVPALPAHGFYSTVVAAPALSSGSVYVGFRWEPSQDQDFFFPVDESLTTPQQVVYSSGDDGATWTYTLSLGRALFIRARSTSDYVALPPAQEFTFGNDNGEDLPFFVPDTRYQQVYDGTEVGPRWISEIRFRGAMGEAGGPICPEPFAGATITLSTTQSQVDGLSSAFSANVGPDAKTVFHGELWVFSRGSTVPGLRPFDVAIPLQSPFYFDGSGNLLLDMNLPNGLITGFHALDTHDDVDGVSRAYCADLPTCNTGNTAFPPDSKGLVTMFLFGSPVLFVDGFESGDFARWSNSTP